MSDAAADAGDPGRDARLVISSLDVIHVGGAHAVRGVDLVLRDGATVALVGESGCGKSTIADAILGLLPRGAAVRGRVLLGPTSAAPAQLDLLLLSERERRGLRGTRLGYVTQDPFAAFDPIRSVAHHVESAWRVHRRRPEAGEVGRRLEALGIADAARRARMRPHQWSGGMLQRASIAAAGALRPDVMIADEPTSALDADLALATLAALRDQADAMLLITHNLALAAHAADEIHVLYAGRVVEHGPSAAVLRSPRHPYTRALLAAIPDGRSLPTPLPGSPPSPHAADSGCPFAPRCRDVVPACAARPALVDGVACHVVAR